MRKLVSILGGSSVATPVLIEEIGRAQVEGRIPSLHIRLHGRDELRLSRVVAYARNKLDQIIGTDPAAAPDIEMSCHTDVAVAVSEADLIICQVRPGGMEFRAQAEKLAIGFDIPGDEGIGPGGLMCFLHGRSHMDRIAEAISTSAPDAAVLMMTSPLGLSVDRFARKHGLRCFGICELPAVTARMVTERVEPKLRAGPLSVSYLGLNHQSWIHVFRDESGRDRTSEVLKLVDDKCVRGIDPGLVKRLSAIPMHYLSLYYCTEEVVAAQRARSRSRGEELSDWQANLHLAYVGGKEVDHGAVDLLLRERDVSWYADGVIPAVSAFLGVTPQVIPLNLPADSTVPGVHASAVVEMPCRVSSNGVTPLYDRALPVPAEELFSKLLDYEFAARSLADQPDEFSIGTALACHPLVNSKKIAAQLAASIHRSISS